MRIDNERANQLLISFRQGKCIREFMSAVVGVENYRLDDPNRQGCIRGMFAKELITDQFLIELDDIVSMFWQGVFENIDRAKLWGEKVDIKTPGEKNQGSRKTLNNPIHWVRKQGAFCVRNYINSLYRKNLQQCCILCGHTTAVKNDKKCNKCNGEMVTTYKFIDINNEFDDFGINNISKDLEDKSIEQRIRIIINNFGDRVLGRNTRAYQVLMILTNPQASMEMCSICKLCNAKVFDIDRCTNYNANIGKYLGVNKTMIANKIRRIRKAFPGFLFSEGTLEANYLLDLIPRKHKGLLSIID